MPELRPYQDKAVATTLDRLSRQNGNGLILDPGVGKTAIVCTVADKLRPDRILVTAPARVLAHWVAELDQWYPNHAPIYPLTGSPDSREFLLRHAGDGIYLITHDMLAWLNKTKHDPFDMFVADESSKLRNWSAKRTKAARKVALRSEHRLVMTGSPHPNCVSEWFSQQFILDRGKTLGQHISRFREQYMHKGGYENREWIFDMENLSKFQASIEPWITRQDSSVVEGFPKVVYNTIDIALPDQAFRAYKEIEKDLYTELTETPLLALSGSARYNICRQMASGSCYIPGTKEPTLVHEAKLEAIEDLRDELPPDAQLLVAYQYEHEYLSLTKRFPKALCIKGGTSMTETNRAIVMWQLGLCPMLIAQSQSISHGINGLQFGGNNVVFYTTPDQPDAFEQLIARLARSGQPNDVVFVHLLQAIRTIDRAVLRRLQTKCALQTAVLDYFQEK